jgi:hypothetical protein
VIEIAQVNHQKFHYSKRSYKNDFHIAEGHSLVNGQVKNALHLSTKYFVLCFYYLLNFQSDSGEGSLILISGGGLQAGGGHT